MIKSAKTNLKLVTWQVEFFAGSADSHGKKHSKPVEKKTYSNSFNIH